MSDLRGEQKGEVLLTRRTYLTLKVMEPQRCARGEPFYPAPVGIFMAAEAVASTAIEHPEWDMDERKRWDEWEQILG